MNDLYWFIGLMALTVFTVCQVALCVLAYYRMKDAEKAAKQCWCGGSHVRRRS